MTSNQIEFETTKNPKISTLECPKIERISIKDKIIVLIATVLGELSGGALKAKNNSKELDR
jgi:hypothetical protein